MNVAVDGLRVGVTDWEAVRTVPREQLPPLSPEQKEVAQKLGMSEDDYARSALAGQRTQEKLLAKTKQLARLLDKKAKVLNAGSAVDNVTLNTWEDRFEIDMNVDGVRVPINIDEALVDDWFERGSREAEESVTRVLSLALPA